MAQVSDKNGCYEWMRRYDSIYNVMIDSVSIEDRVNAESYRLGATTWLEIGVHWDDGRVDDGWMPGMPPPPAAEPFDNLAVIDTLRANWQKYVDSSKKPNMRIDAVGVPGIPDRLSYTLFSELIDQKKAKPEDASLISDDYLNAVVEDMMEALGLNEQETIIGSESAINQGLPPAPPESPEPPTPQLRELPPQPSYRTSRASPVKG